jgi:hypothetical protein
MLKQERIECRLVSTFFHISKTSGVDRHNFDADPGSDPNPTFHFDADPDLDPGHTPSFTHLGKSYFFYFHLPHSQFT